MEQTEKKTSILVAPIMAATVAIMVVTLLTVIGELQPGWKDWLKGAFTHHWLGKGALALAAFLVSWVLLVPTNRLSDERRVETAWRWLFWTGVFATVALALLFMIEARRS
ncbi:MAG: hypothetical protein HYY50_04870 [Candidatus Kerfeldbacteria bacterium]|nr:hypothetical protein [Candidatus Kerfeldbacteria bacterium]